MFGLPINRVDEIQQCAIEVSRRCSGGGLPVSPRNIILANGIFVHHADSKSEFDALFDLSARHPPYDLYLRDRRADELPIRYNRRQRFTEAHELGHFFLHLDRQQVHRDSFKTVLEATEAGNFTLAEIEIEANSFAAELLMPSEVFRRDLEASQIRGGDAWKTTLVQKYGVSYQAIDMRIARLRDNLVISGYAWEDTGKIETLIPSRKLEVAYPIIAKETWKCNPHVRDHVVRHLPSNLLRDLKTKICTLGIDEVAAAKDEKDHVSLRNIFPNVEETVFGNIYLCGCRRNGRKIYFEIELICTH